MNFGLTHEQQIIVDTVRSDAASIKLPMRIPYHIALDILLTGRWLTAGKVTAGLSSMTAEDQCRIG
jgi:hypothetical protein